MTAHRFPLLAACAALATSGAAADTLMLQQMVRPDEAATVALVVDRDRLVTARIRQGAKPPYKVEMTLVGEPR